MAYSNGVILGEFNKGIMYKILAGLSETNEEHESIIKLVARGATSILCVKGPK